MSWSRWAALGFLGALTFLAAVAPERLDTRPSVVDGVQVMTVGQVLGGRAAGQIGGELVAVGGYWSDNVMPTTGMCRGQDTLALGCYDGEFGITEMNEHILLMSKYGELTAAQGPHLTPFMPNALPRLGELWALRNFGDELFPPVPIVVVGHFDDPRATECDLAELQRCRDRLVLNRIAYFNPALARRPDSEVPSPPLSISNHTSAYITLVINGTTIETLSPGDVQDPISAALPLLPWSIETRSPSGRVLSRLSISPTDVIDLNTGKAIRVDLTCGKLEVWAGPPLLSGPTFSPGPTPCD